MPVMHAIVALVVMQAVQAIGGDIVASVFRNVPENDVIFTDCLLFEKPVRTRVQCTLLCANSIGCTTFTFTENSVSSGTCRGHSTLLCCKLPCTPKANTRYYKKSDLEINGSCRSMQKLQPGSGVRQLNLCGSSLPVSAYCDQDTDNGGWTVIQRRFNGSEEFYRTYGEYKAGFGDPAGEYWLGLETIYRITACRRHEIRFDVQLYTNRTGFAVYSNFSLGPDSDFYRFYYVAKTSGNLSDSLYRHHQRKFSTWDSDNDDLSGNSCAMAYKGGWWYGGCVNVGLNNVYSNTSACPGDCFQCQMWRGFDPDCSNALQKTAIKIRPV